MHTDQTVGFLREGSEEPHTKRLIESSVTNKMYISFVTRRDIAFKLFRLAIIFKAFQWRIIGMKAGQDRTESFTHVANPDVKLASGMHSRPSLSRTGLISNAAKMLAIMSQISVSAKNRPGQIL